MVSVAQGMLAVVGSVRQKPVVHDGACQCAHDAEVFHRGTATILVNVHPGEHLCHGKAACGDA